MRVNTRTGKTKAVKVPQDTFAWLLDADGEARVATTRTGGTHKIYLDDGKRWSELASFDPLGPSAVKPALYLDRRLYVSARNGNDQWAVYRYDLDKRSIEAEPWIAAPGYDVDGNFIVDSKSMLGYRFVTDAEVTTWFDAGMKKAQQDVDRLLPSTVNTLSRGRSSVTPYVLVDSWSDVRQHRYAVYNLEDKTLVLLHQPDAALDAARMAPVAMTRYKARDGLDVPIYYTLPPVATPKQLPTVVLVNRNPWQRSVWEWDEEVQFLATRGYAVLQPQSRGMHGYGERHQRAGDRQWGLAMQDDLADAVKWAVAQGYTDPARVCIMGNGYGGYAAMMGLIKDPELYKCGISWSGITDIDAMFGSGWHHFMAIDDEGALARQIGSRSREAAQFRQTSPLVNAARIRQPVLLAYGTTDESVPYAHGKKFYEALSASNAQVQWLSYTPTVEDWKTQKNRIDLWQNIDAFLQRHIGSK